MSATADGGAVAVTKPGHCKREVLIGKKIHVVKHSWRIHVCEVELVTTLLGEKYPHRTLNKKTSYVMNTEEALSSKGEEMAECVLKNRRDQFMRIQQQQQQQTGGRGSSSRISSSRSSKSKTSADSSGVVCPIISALRGGGDVAGKTFSEVVKKPPAEPRDGHEDIGGLKAPPAFVEAMKSMTAEGFLRLMVSQGMKGAAKLRQERQEGRELQAAMKSALADAKVHGRTVEGRRAFQTILTAAAYDAGGGKDASIGGYKPSTNPVTAKRMAEILDVHPDFFSVARKRAKRLRADMPPAAAINEGVYWYQPRLRRCDAASPELVRMMERFWHTDGVSRPSGAPDDDDNMFRESHSAGSAGHPRRELILPRGGEAVYSRFLVWSDYLRFKEGQAKDFTDPGRTLFLSTRCKCLALPTRAGRPARVQE